MVVWEVDPLSFISSNVQLPLPPSLALDGRDAEFSLKLAAELAGHHFAACLPSGHSAA
jgi:hypothetical protein